MSTRLPPVFNMQSRSLGALQQPLCLVYQHSSLPKLETLIVSCFVPSVCVGFTHHCLFPTTTVQKLILWILFNNRLQLILIEPKQCPLEKIFNETEQPRFPEVFIYSSIQARVLKAINLVICTLPLMAFTSLSKRPKEFRRPLAWTLRNSIRLGLVKLKDRSGRGRGNFLSQKQRL